MGIRFRKSVKIGPFRFTASKSGISSSIGFGGARITKRADGRIQTTAGIKGTGIHYTEVHKTSHSKETQTEVYEKPVKKHPILKGLFFGFFIILGICLMMVSPFAGVTCISIGVIIFIVGRKNKKNK